MKTLYKAALASLFVLPLLYQPAYADEHRFEHRRDFHHERMWHPVRVYHPMVAPVYAPAQVVYYPQPVYAAPMYQPGISVVF